MIVESTTCDAHIKASFTWKFICLLDLFLFSFLQLNELNEKILGPHHICILFKMRFPFWFDKNPRFHSCILNPQSICCSADFCMLALRCFTDPINWNIFIICAISYICSFSVMTNTCHFKHRKDAVSGCSKNILTGEVSRGSWIKIHVSLIQIQAGAWNFSCE